MHDRFDVAAADGVQLVNVGELRIGGGEAPVLPGLDAIGANHVASLTREP